MYENRTIVIFKCRQHVLCELPADVSTARAAHPRDRHQGEVSYRWMTYGFASYLGCFDSFKIVLVYS